MTAEQFKRALDKLGLDYSTEPAVIALESKLGRKRAQIYNYLNGTKKIPDVVQMLLQHMLKNNKNRC